MIAPQLLAWWDKHGRKHLPWQKDRSPYRIWVSEIVLQQTRVETVMPCFERFMASFPDMQSLAAAQDDDVLAIWAGLGYYTRAHNMLKTASIVVTEHGGELPRDFGSLMALPGIGRSTAGAILALAHGQRRAILDGNARRVLARVHAVEGWPGKTPVSRTLWNLADANTPSERVRDYTQAIMDLGATVCLRRGPRCDTCPLASFCRAKKNSLTAEIPASKPKANRPLKRRCMLVVQRPDSAVLLYRRPPTGIWAGLWSLPILQEKESPKDWCRRVLGCSPDSHAELAPIRHGFSHFKLEIRPIHLPVSTPSGEIKEGNLWRWHDGAQNLGMPAPVHRLVESLGISAGGLRPVRVDAPPRLLHNPQR